MYVIIIIVMIVFNTIKQAPGRRRSDLRLRPVAPDALPGRQTLFWKELRGSQAMGVVSNSWFDRALLSVLCMFRPSCCPMFKPPSLGAP